MFRFKLFLAVCAALVLSVSPGQASEAQLEITEWVVPWSDTRPRDPWYGPQDIVWFVGQVGHYVATLDPKTGEFKRYDLEAGAGPHTVIADEAGAWYAGNRVQHIGLIDPATGSRDIFELPGDGQRDPHTMAFNSRGDIWFTVQHGNQVGLLQRETRRITLYTMEIPRSRPYGLVVDDQDRPWFVLFGTNALGTIDPATAELRTIRLPRSDARPRRLDVTADGMIWYVDFAQGYLGRYDPRTEKVDEWLTPGGRASGPYAMGADGQGRLWFVETGMRPNRFVGFDPESENFTEPFAIDSGGGTVRHMMFQETTGSFWFGTDTNTIGRAKVR
jgi:virginiamycin B lyase